jgi:hypothetical protein
LARQVQYLKTEIAWDKPTADFSTPARSPPRFLLDIVFDPDAAGVSRPSWEFRALPFRAWREISVTGRRRRCKSVNMRE